MKDLVTNTNLVVAVAVIGTFVAAIGKYLMVTGSEDYTDASTRARAGMVMETLGPLMIATAGVGVIAGYVAFKVTGV